MQQTISHTVEAELPIDVRIHPTHFTTADIMALDAPSSPLSSVPSSPLSSLGRTPTPPRDYPSPPLSTLSGTTSPMPKLRFSQDGPPPAKKRKLSAPKPRTTERLDLTSFGDNSTKEQIDHQVNQLKRLVHALRGKRKIVVVAGAGISVSAGSKCNLLHPNLC